MSGELASIETTNIETQSRLSNWLESVTHHVKISAAMGAAVLAPIVGVFTDGPAASANTHRSLELTQVVPDATSSYYHASTLTTQGILNRIHHTVFPLDNWKKSDKFRVLVSSAALHPSSGEFRTDCQGGNHWSFRYYHITTNGLHKTACGIADTGNTKATPDEFLDSLNHLGQHIEQSVNGTPSSKTRSIVGNRTSVTAVYKCENQGDIQSVVIRKGKKAIITDCPA